MLTALLVVSFAQLPTSLELLENSESGDATQYVQLRSKGAYQAQATDKERGNTVVTGTWKMVDDTLEVKAAGCKGPGCKELKRDYTAKATVMAARALTLQSTAPAPFFPSGSYYCHYLGCEPRLGVEIVSKAANVRALHAVEDHLIGRNVGRNSTVVWIGPRSTTETKTSRIEVCGRDPEKSKKALEQLQGDLAEASWLGAVTVVETPVKDCLWDVRFFVRDDVQPPVKPRR